MKTTALLATLMVVATRVLAQDVGDIPLSECTTEKALMTAQFAALSRETTTAPAMLKAMDEFKNLADKYSRDGKPGQSIGELMTKADSIKFATLSSQTLTMRYYELAESRLQRDMGLLEELHAMALKERDQGLDLAHMNDLVRDGHLEAGTHRGMNRELLVYTYLNTLKEAFKNDDAPAARATGECSVGLALESENKVTYSVWLKQVELSSALKEIAGLRDKYNVAQGAGFESVKLSAEDAQRVAFLQPQVVTLFRPMSFFGEMNGLRFFAEAAYLEYGWQKNDILQLGGSANASDYSKLDAARYAKLSLVQQRAINVWQHLDGDLPSQSMLDAETVAKAAEAAGK